jgi:outer membrane receptor protein involved in Fe transport
VEVIKGPQSAVYGRVGPGGVVNYVSKKPQTRFHTGFSSIFGSYDYSRVDAYVTGPLIRGKLFYRVDLSYYDFERATDYWFNRTFNASGGLTYKFSQQTSITLEFEHTDKIMNSFPAAVRYIDHQGSDNPSDWVISGNVHDLPNRGVAKILSEFNPYG